MQMVAITSLLDEAEMGTWSLLTLREKFCNFLLNYGYCKEIVDCPIDNSFSDSKFEDFAYGVFIKIDYSYFVDTLVVDVIKLGPVTFLTLGTENEDATQQLR